MGGARFSAAACAVALAIGIAAGTGGAASADEGRLLEGTPFESGANVVARGATVRRSSLDGTLTSDDRRRLRALGLGRLHAAAVVVHHLPKTDAARQRARLRALSHRLDGFAPSGACDGITSDGDGTGVCTGSVDGPLGRVPVRMPVAARLAENDDGSVHLLIHNVRPMEAKALFSWSPVVAPEHLKVAIDLYPAPDGDGWLVYTRVGIEMSDHESSAKTISDALLKLDSWLSRDLARA